MEYSLNNTILKGYKLNQKYKDIYGESFELSELSDEIQLEIIKQELIIQKTLLANARSMGFVNDYTKTLAKKNIIAKDLFTKKYKPKIVKPKKGKGSFKRKKI